VALGCLLLAACAAKTPRATVAVPSPQAGELRIVAATAENVGDVQPIALGVTNGRPTTVHLQARQIYGHADDTPEGGRVAPLPPGEAARQAGGRRAPGAVRRAATGAVTGSVLGAAGGAISGAIQGGVGLATGAGAAVGAFFGIIGGVLGGGSQPDVAGFEDRALHDAALESGFSATGYVYYPPGTYREVEVLVTDADGQTESLRVPVGACDETPQSACDPS
jgi:hypothetical protein